MKIEVILIKKLITIVLLIGICIPISGCWNYRGLNKVSIVTGVAIDRNTDNDNYHLTVETIDVSTSGKEGTGTSQLVEGEGKTIFEAIRNAKKRLSKKLYVSDVKVIVISNQIARQEGIKSSLDWFMRDAETRETAIPVISQEKTAKEIFTAGGVDDKIISEELEKIIEGDRETTASTRKIANYQTFNILQSGNETALVLPAVHCTSNKDKKVVELNGTAVFKEDKLQGYLSPEETSYYLFAVNEIAGGIMTFPLSPEHQDSIALEISKNKTKKSYSYDGNHLKVFLDVNTTAKLGEVNFDIDTLKDNNVEKIKSAANLAFLQNIQAVIKKGQMEFDCDIFGVGTMIHKSDPALWYKLKDNWEQHIQTMEVEVRPKFVIVNTGLIK